ncbi:MAG: recombinase family protein, partial [Pseudomonadota bacterium]
MQPTAMTVAIYARVSTGKQAASDLSIPDQLAQCQRYCEGKGWSVAKSFVEAGASATTDDRPEFQAMIAEACTKTKPFDVIMVHSQSRFARNVLDLLSYENKLTKAGVSLVSMTQDIGNTSEAAIMRTMIGAMDEHHSRETSKHVKRSMKENTKQGFWNGSQPPFGFETYVAEIRGTKEKKKLKICDHEAEIVRLIFRLYTQGNGKSGPMGLRKLVGHINDQGYTNRQGRAFRVQYVGAILRNSAYIGQHWFNRTDTKTKRLRPQTEWIELKSDAIIDAYTFQSAQDRLTANAPAMKPPRLVSSNVLLTDIAFCGQCGSRLRLMTGKNNRYRYYKCSRKADHGATECKGVEKP